MNFGINCNTFTYPTVVMETKAHQKPSNGPRRKDLGNSRTLNHVSYVKKTLSVKRFKAMPYFNTLNPRLGMPGRCQGNRVTDKTHKLSFSSLFLAEEMYETNILRCKILSGTKHDFLEKQLLLLLYFVT